MLVLMLVLLQLLIQAADLQATHTRQGHQALPVSVWSARLRPRLTALPPQEVPSGLGLMIPLSCGLTDHHAFQVLHGSLEMPFETVVLRVENY